MKKRLMKLMTSLVLVGCVLGMTSCGRAGISDDLKQKLCVHSYEETEVLVEATCTEKGEVVKVCSDCGKTITEKTKALGHQRVADSSVQGTCITPGLSAGVHCARCGDVIVAQEELKGAHSYLSNGVCRLCHDGMQENTVGSGELVAGNWYRIYRNDPVQMLSIYSGSEVSFFATTDLENADNYLFYDGSMSRLEGMQVLVLEDFIDLYFESGNYYIINAETNEKAGALSITESTAITGTSPNVYRLSVKKEVLPDTSTFKEVAVEDGEKVAGNWYRIYRSNLRTLFQISHKGTLSGVGSFYAQAVRSETEDYYFYDYGLHYWEGLSVIFTENYIDVYFETGTYNVVFSVTNTIVGTVTIDDSTQVLSAHSVVHRLVENI